MKKIAVLTVVLALAIFVMPTNAGPPGPPEYVTPVEVVNEPTVHVGSMPDVNIANTPLPVTVTNQTNQVEVRDALFRGYILGIGGTETLYIIDPVPAGRVFVLTDIDVRCEAGCPDFLLQLTDRVDSSSTVRYDISILGAGVTHDSLQLTSGITFQPAHEVYAVIYNNGPSEKHIQVLLSGYLVDE